MVNERFGKLKDLQFPISFQNWIFTLLFLPLAIYFRFIIGTSLILDKDYSSYLRSTWILGVLFLLWILWKWLRDQELVITGLEPALGGFFLVVCLSTFFSENSSFSLEKLIGITAYLVGAYILVDLKRYPQVWQGIINALLITAGFSSLLILVSALPWINLYQLTPGKIIANPIYLLEVIPRLPYSMGLHQSVTAGYLVMILPLAIYQLRKTRRWLSKAIQIAGILMNISVLFLTQSRGGLLGLFSSALVVIILLRKRIIEYVREHKLLSGLAGLILVLIGGGVFALLARTRGFDLGGLTVQMRFHQWQAGLQIIGEKPWLGSGLGTYGLKYLEIRDPAFYPGTFIHAHNQLVQITAELGLLGLLSLLLLLWSGIRVLRQDPAELTPASKTALIGLGGLFGVLIPDAILTSSMIVLLLLFYLVWMLPANRVLTDLARRSALAAVSAIGVIILGACGWILWKIHPYDQALKSAAQEDWAAASASLGIAQSRDRDNPYYPHAIGFTNGQLACQLEEYANLAIASYQDSLEVYPNWGIDRANTSVLYAMLGDFQSAAAEMERAIQEFPQQAQFNCLLGDYYYQLERTADAFSSYTDCILKAPGLIDSPYWQEDPGRSAILPDLIRAVEMDLVNRQADGAVKLLASLYSAAGKIDLARTSIEDYLAIHPNDLGGNLIYLKILEDHGALIAGKELIQKLLSANPRSSDLWLIKGKLDQQEGNLDQAEASYLLAHKLQPSTKSKYLLAGLYTAQGNIEDAQQILSATIDITAPYRMGDFSRQVAGRWPFREEYLDCMPQISSYSDEITPALDAAQGIETSNCSLAACIYQEWIDHQPGSGDAASRFEELPCRDSVDLNACYQP